MMSVETTPQGGLEEPSGSRSTGVPSGSPVSVPPLVAAMRLTSIQTGLAHLANVNGFGTDDSRAIRLQSIPP